MPTTLGTPTSPTYTDSQFGGPAWRVTPTSDARVIFTDAIQTVITADNKTLLTGKLPSGPNYFTKLDGSGDSCIAANYPAYTPDPTIPNTFYYFNGTQGTQGTGVAGVNKGVGDPCKSPTVTTIATYSGFADVLTNSSDGSPSKEGYWAVMTNTNSLGTGNDPVVMIVDLHKGGVKATLNYSTINLLNNSLANGLPGQACQLRGEITNSKEVSPATGKLWFIVTVGSNCKTAQDNVFMSWVPGSSTITVEGGEPLDPRSNWNNGSNQQFKVVPSLGSDCATGWCNYAGHADFVSVPVNGVNHEMYLKSGGGAVYAWEFLMDLDAGGPAKAMVPVEDGGGLYQVFQLNHNTSSTHQGCSYNGVCLLSVDNNGNATWCSNGNCSGNSNTKISAISTGSRTQFTVSSANFLANGQQLLMNGVTGIPQLAGVNTACTVSSLNTSTGTFVCSGLTTTGSWRGGGSFTQNITVGTDSHQMENIVLDFSRGSTAPLVRRLLEQRNWIMSDTLVGSYWSQSHGIISPDGTLSCYGTNGGIPDQMMVMCGPTGFAAAKGGTSAVGAAGTGSVSHKHQ
jgi:hypothetical protein